MAAFNLDTLYRIPPWITDLVVGVVVVLFTAAAAHSAVVARIGPGQAEARGLRGAVEAAAAETPAPALVFSDPVEGYEVVSPFGLRRLPWEDQARLHAGVDIAAPAGLPVRAVADGIVARTGRDGAYGRFVEVRHAGGLTSFYAHLGAVSPKIGPGLPVSRGEAVGRIGSTGSSTGAHLHLELRGPKGRPLDPGAFLGRQFAALEELPFKAAARVPRTVRVAYVSYIPVAKRALMAVEAPEPAEAAEAEPLVVAARAAAAPASAAQAAAKDVAGGGPAAPPKPLKPPKAADFLDPDAPIATAAHG